MNRLKALYHSWASSSTGRDGYYTCLGAKESIFSFGRGEKDALDFSSLSLTSPLIDRSRLFTNDVSVIGMRITASHGCPRRAPSSCNCFNTDARFSFIALTI